MKAILAQIILLPAVCMLLVETAFGQGLCAAADRTVLEQNYQSKSEACAASQTQENDASTRVQSLTAQRSALFEKTAKKFGRSCVTNLLRGKKNNRCKGRAAAKAAPSIRKLKALDSSIKAAGKKSSQLSASRQQTCAEKDQAASALAAYLYDCPPANTNPPPDTDFRPDLANLLFYAVPDSETALPAPSWLMSKWAYYSRGEGYQFNFKTNGVYEILYVYKCSGCVITDASAAERGTYAFDGTTLVLSGTTVMEFKYSDGHVANETTAVTSTHQVSLVTMEELSTGAVRQKLGLKLSGTGLMINRDSSDEVVYYLERSDW